MKWLITIILIIFISTYSTSQVGKYAGYYFGTASSDSMYGRAIDSTVTLDVELILNLDSTYRMNWHIKFGQNCNFFPFWTNTGRWLNQNQILLFSLDEDWENWHEPIEIRASLKHGLIDIPIKCLFVNDPVYNLKKRDAKRHYKFRQNNEEFKYYLKIKDDSSIQFGASWDCIEEVWPNNSIKKVESFKLVD